MNFLQTVVATAIGFFIVRGFDAFAFRGSVKVSQQDYDLAELRSSAAEIRQHAQEYWSLDGSDARCPLLHASIVGRMSYISSTVTKLFENHDQLRNAVFADLNRFDEAVTGGRFGEIDRGTEVNKLIGVEKEYFSFIHKLETCQRKIPRPWLEKF